MPKGPHEVPMMEDWENIRYREAPERCPMCGALRIHNEVDHHRQGSEVPEIIRRLAIINEENPTALQLLLSCILHPTETANAVATRLGKNKDKIKRCKDWLIAHYPGLSTLLGRASPASAAQQNRQKKGKKRKTKQFGK